MSRVRVEPRAAIFLAALALTAVLGLLGGGAAFASCTSTPVSNCLTNLSSFSDPRGDLPSRDGQLTRAMYGPYTVPAASGTTLGQTQSAPAVPAPCANCRITDMVPNLVFSADGVTPSGPANLADGLHLHHFVFLDATKQSVTCPGTPNPFFGSGNERTHLHFPSNYGYDNTSASWSNFYHLVNRSTAPKTVYVEVVFRWKPTSAGDTRPATNLWLDIDLCGDSEYTAPVGYSDVHRDWTSTVSGYVIGTAGHQHDVDVTSPNPPDRCEVHCPGEGEARAVSAEIVDGPSSVYYGPSPPNNPTHVPGATLCRSEAYHGTPFGGPQRFNGHLDTMSACGVFDSPPTRQPEAYPLDGAMPFPGYYLKTGDVLRLHSEYDNNTSGPQPDVMGIMMLWVANANYARPQAGAQFRVPLTVAYNECVPGVGNNRTHGPTLTAGSCNPQAQKSSFLTVGTLDANSFNSSSVGFAKLTACPTGTTATGTCSTPAGMTSPDLRMELSTTDVRCKAGVATCEGGVNSDYTGELRANLGLRITDKHNSTTAGGTGDDGTVTAVSIPLTATCAVNGSGGSPTAIGGTCSVLTRANAVTPGSVPVAKRSNWEIARVDVIDGGSDGDVDTGGNTVFETQGIFIP